MRGWPEDLEERRWNRRRVPAAGIQRYADAFSRNREGDDDGAPLDAGDAVAGLIQVFDGNIECVSHGSGDGRGKTAYPMPSSSTSKISVAFGGITPPAPRAP